jgi:hypothetical protein
VRAEGLKRLERLDAVALLGVYSMAPLLMVGWLASVILFYLNPPPLLGGAIALLALVSYGALGNFAAFFEIAAATFLDGSSRRIRLLPLGALGFVVSVYAISRATFDQVVKDHLLHAELRWDKTPRYRKAA